MRCAEPISCAVAAGLILTQLGSVPALAETHGAAPDLRERDFFARFDDPLPGEAEARIVPIGEPRLPSAAVGEMMPVATGRGAVTVLAALAPPRDAPMLDTGLPPWATPRPMPWASGPAVPRPLSEPPPEIEANDRKLAPDGPLPTLPELPLAFGLTDPRAGIRHASRQSLPIARDSWTMSRLPGPPKIASHAGDPIATPELEEETPAPAKEKAPPPVAAPPAFIMPFANGRVTSLYNQGRRHPAIDLAGPLGSAVLATTMQQTVVFAGWRGGYGNAVIARDPSGRLHLYGHLRSITARVGELLDQGTKLGHLGSTGRSTGPHVHYEVRDGKGGHINPVTLLFPGRSVSKGFAWADVHLPSRPTTVASAQPLPR